MRRLPKTVPIIACFCLLSLQLSGVHVHANLAGLVGGPETFFTHTHGRHDDHVARHGNGHGSSAADHGDTPPARDYEDAEDVSLLKVALAIFKLPFTIPALILLFALIPRVDLLAGVDIVYPVLSGRYTRWRPPLRAPPPIA